LPNVALFTFAIANICIYNLLFNFLTKKLYDGATFRFTYSLFIIEMSKH